MGIFEKFKLGFKKSASTFTSGLKDIITKKEIDDKTLNKVEDYLIYSDVGVEAAADIKDIIAQERINPNKNITKYSLQPFISSIVHSSILFSINSIFLIKSKVITKFKNYLF